MSELHRGSPTAWPDLPRPGDLVRLPLPLPPMLCEAADYRGSARYVAMHWTPYGDDLIVRDGTVTHTGYWPTWTTLRHHELGRLILGPYELGSSDGDQAVHWLLADRHAQTLDVGLERDVAQLLATQPSELAAAAEILGAKRLVELLHEHARTAPT